MENLMENYSIFCSQDQLILIDDVCKYVKVSFSRGNL